MVKLLFALIFGFVLKGSLAVLEPYTCDPYEDCATAAIAGAIVPDPDNCHNFFVCINVGGEIVPSTNSLPCPDGEYFDQSLRSCRVEDTPGICGPNVCALKLCTSVCPPEFVSFTTAANNLNCSSYYACLEPSPVLISCPSDTPYFDGTTCVSDPSKCCDFCTAYCLKAVTQIVDPCDCTSFYICIDVGEALPNFRSTCPSGTYYDETTTACIAGTCNSICPNCGVINPTTTLVETSTTTSSADTTTTSSAATTTTSSADSTTTSSSDTTITSSSDTTTTSSSDTTTTSSSDTTTTSSAITATTPPGDTTTTTTPTDGCQSVESFICPTDGNYPKCPYCNREYFYCQDGVASEGRCSGNTVFNPIPEYPYCLDPSNCPYS